MILRVRTVNETFDPCDVTALSGSHLVTLFVRRLKFVLLSVITPWAHLYGETIEALHRAPSQQLPIGTSVWLDD